MTVEWAEPAHYLAIDPGESSGWATFNEDGSGNRFGILQGREAVYLLLQKVQPHVLIVEDFSLFPGKAQAQIFSKFETVRVIGAIEFWAWAKQVPVHLQPPNIKSMGYKWAGIKPSSNHQFSHDKDAFVHGVYWLQKNGIRKLQQGRA